MQVKGVLETLMKIRECLFSLVESGALEVVKKDDQARVKFHLGRVLAELNIDPETEAEQDSIRDLAKGIESTFGTTAKPLRVGGDSVRGYEISVKEIYDKTGVDLLPGVEEKTGAGETVTEDMF